MFVECLQKIFQVIYSQLIQFSLTAAQDSIQAAIASEAHVSSLRIVDIFLSSASQTAGVDVWCVALQSTKNICSEYEKISTSGSCCCRSRRLTRTRSRTWTTPTTRCSPPSRPTTRSASSSGRSGGCWSPSRRAASSRCSSVLVNIFPS